MKKYTLLPIVIFMLIITIIFLMFKGDRRSINNWMTEHNIVTKDIDYTFVGGPYFHHKNVRIYKVFTSSNDVYWVKISLFGNEVSKENKSGEYTEIKW